MRNVTHRIRKATSTPKGRIIFFSVLLLIAAIIAGGIIYWNIYKKQIIRERLESAVSKKSKGLYRISYDELKLDEINGSLSVTNLKMHFDSLQYVALRNHADAPPTVFRITIPNLTVTGVKTPRALIDKEIVGTKVEIIDPVIEILYTRAGKDSTRSTPTKEVYEQILGNLNLIRMDTVNIIGATITTGTLKGKRLVELTNTSVQLTELRVDSLANDDKSRLLFSRTLALQCEKISWSSSKKPYRYSVDSITLSSAAQEVHVKAFRIEPLLGEEAFVHSLPTQDDRFNFVLQDIRVLQLDFPQLMMEKIRADSIVVGQAFFHIYRDLSIVRDKKNRVGTYPHQAVARIPVPVQVKKLVLSSAFVEYKERNAKTRQAGKVQFYHCYATISNLTNEHNTGNNIMLVDINCRFLNKAPLHLTWTFYLFNPNGRFDVKGTLGAIDARQVNVLSEPMGPARIEGGQISQLTFNLTGDNYTMHGPVKLLYKNLKVAVLQKDEETKKLEKKKLASFAANIVIKNSNPSGNKDEPRVSQVTNERNTNRSIFHLSWKTLFKGIKATVGINK